MSKYVFTDDMNEISGFGGSYEQACRSMVVAGIEWLDEHPGADPKFSEYPAVYGVMSKDNDDAKALSEVVGVAHDGCSGAMHQASIGHILLIKRMGWDKYVEESKARAAAKNDN